MPSQIVYHRILSGTQTQADLDLQEQSRELWGQAHQGGLFPSAKAYVGPLPAGKIGIEFTTDLQPSAGGLPKEARWRNPPATDAPREGFVRIPITILRIERGGEP